ncbi:hypothetical protein ACQ4PT_004924 [Festuca glaucescens]
MGMRCKRHPFQAGGGVCATCLRDRLLVLAAAQNDASSPSPAPPPHRLSAAPPPPAGQTAPAFPRSVSPYVSRRKSDSSGGALRSHHPSLLFFRTPQVGPSAPLEEGDIGYEKRRAGKFSVLSTLFGNHHSRSEEDRDRAKERKNRSWLAGIIPRRRKKQQAPADAAASPPTRRSCRAVSNRGLSPERGSSGEEESCSPAADADPPWRPSPSPMRKAPCRRRQSGGGMPSGLAVCLSPLVRPSPGRRRRAAAASVPRCRSRKLADGARFR